MKRTIEEEGGMAFPDDKYFGMTLRDYFAAKAMQGMRANWLHWWIGNRRARKSGEDWNKLVSEWAYDQADAMLKARQG